MVAVQFLALVASACAVPFLGIISGIPETSISSHHPLGSQILNSANIPSRFSISLYNGTQKYSTILDANYSFEYDLNEGEYSLLVQSHDYVLESSRFRLMVNNESQIMAFSEKLSAKSYNKTSGRLVSKSEPLEIQYIQLKNYYEVQDSSLIGFINNSPFGFIFQSKLYSFIFALCIGTMILPLALQYFMPDLMKDYQELKRQSRTGVTSSPNPQIVSQPTTAGPGSSTSVQRNTGRTNQRRKQ